MAMPEGTRPWIGVDFDRTLATMDTYEAGKVGQPIWPMVYRVRTWLTMGYCGDDGESELVFPDVRIFTARVASDGTPAGIAEAQLNESAIKRWCLHYFGRELAVTSSKNWGLIAIYDDIAHHVQANTGEIGEPDE